MNDDLLTKFYSMWIIVRKIRLKNNNIWSKWKTQISWICYWTYQSGWVRYWCMCYWWSCFGCREEGNIETFYSNKRIWKIVQGWWSYFCCCVWCSRWCKSFDWTCKTPLPITSLFSTWTSVYWRIGQIYLQPKPLLHPIRLKQTIWCWSYVCWLGQSPRILTL